MFHFYFLLSEYLLEEAVLPLVDEWHSTIQGIVCIKHLFLCITFHLRAISTAFNVITQALCVSHLHNVKTDNPTQKACAQWDPNAYICSNL